METAFVIAKSKKAKNRFANQMNHNDLVVIEQHKGNKVFVSSAEEDPETGEITINGKNHFWINLNQDSDWSIEL
jgi:hypothetical protein